jgi:hypothetical protein
MSELRGFERFIEERGQVKIFDPPTTALIEKYKERLPEYMIQVWKTFGFGSYADGLFFITSPEPFEKILEIYFGKDHSHTVICRSSFGDLMIWDNEQPSIISLDSSMGRGSRMADDGNINGFFKYTMDNDRIYKIHNYDLHLKAIEKFGQLEEDQVFAFVPALALGGAEKLENIKVSQLREYLAIIAELAVENNREAAAQGA